MTQTCYGYVALIGEPNAGKSTLMNRLIGAKISIVTHKVQTTRTRVRGIAIEGHAQLVFIDTPGLFQTRRNLDRAMVAAAWSGVEDSDIVAFLIEAHRGMTEGVRDILEGLKSRKRTKQKIILLINKIDLVRPESLLKLTQDMNNAFLFEETFMISAENGSGLDALRQYLSTHIPPGPWHYPEDQIADVPLRMIAAEMTREKLMLRLHQELPYYLTVETTGWETRKDGSIRIDQIVYVVRDRHKGIALGPKGETIKAIGMAARTELKDFLQTEVHLFIQVKTRPKWENESARFTEMGLMFPKASI